MKTAFTHLLPQNFDDRSRVWIYQSNRRLTLQEALFVEEMLNTFVASWNSHGIPVKGYANLFFGQFIVLIADETAYGVSGCSTDSSVRLMKEIESRLGIQLFDRLLLAFIVKDNVQMLPVPQLNYALQNGFITADAIYVNNTVQTLAQLKSEWLTPVNKSWIANDKRFATLLQQTPAE